MDEKEFPFYGKVPGESVYFLTDKVAIPMPVPPTMRNHHNVIASLLQVGTWMAKQAEALGVMLLPETPGVKVLVKDGAICGVRNSSA